ncbi:DUF1684 domain-containing protein [Microbacterium sp.]|uniref:DUF1684 domain-containing protein n=1 Tax=Microbacterium sp. TaxID=51671 RepID=UPI0039E54C99
MSAREWETWREARWKTVAAPYGTAALDLTEWLDDGPRTIDGLPGAWRAEDGVVIGDLPEGELRLAPGEEHDIGGRRLRAFLRDGAFALRILDPASPRRATLTGIQAYPYDPAWVVEGEFRAAPEGEQVDVAAVDGVVSRARLAGTIALPTPEGEVELTVTAAGDRLSAVFADATNGTETYRFRFLEVGARDGDRITVDFNRAHLPPCAFSDQYVCPLPLPGNRWAIPVRAGERNPIRAG